MDFFPFEGLDGWRLLAGLGIFLFGMFLLEEGVQVLSGQAFQRLLQRFTSNRIKAVATGTVATAILQSSSAVSLMVLAFAGAGILAMPNAIGVVIGANLGTTLKAWILATVGFKVNIEAFALPFIGVGGLMLAFFGHKPRLAAVSRLLTGFGFLFMGLEFMKAAVSGYTATVGPDQFKDLHPILFWVFGLILTAITQSSSASLAIILSALHAGIAGFFPAALFMIGANMGTTITVMLGALGGSPIKKRVAMSHVLFNWITGLVMIVLLSPVVWLIGRWVNTTQDPVMALAVFHTFFNLSGVLFFLPFTGTLGRWVTIFFPDKPSDETIFLAKTPAKVGGAASEALRKEAWHLIHDVMCYQNRILQVEHLPDFHIPEIQNLPRHHTLSLDTLYDNLKKISNEMHRYGESVQVESLSAEQSELVNRALFSVRMAIFSAKWFKDLNLDLMVWEDRGPEALSLRHDLQQRQIAAYNDLSSFLSEGGATLEHYSAMKQSLSRKEKQFEHQLLTQNADNTHRDAVALARQLTINKTWQLAWRNMLIALRELEIGEALNESLELS
jgi:phosphate:Na+ symporter